MSYHDTAIVGIIYYCTRIGVSVLRTGRGRAGGGGGGGKVEFLTEKKKLLRNVPGVLKRKKKKKKLGGGAKKIFGGGGGFWGVWGAPRPHPGVARGWKTIHFFL